MWPVVAHAQQSYQLANAYAMERIQGRKKIKALPG